MAHKNKQWNELPFEFMWRILISHQSFFGKCHKMVGFYGGLISSLRSHTHHLKIKKRLSLIYLEIIFPSSYVEKIPIWPTWKHLLFDTSFIFHWKPNSKMSLLCLKVSDTKVRRILSSIFCHMSSKWKLSQTGCNFILPLLFFLR